MLDWRLEFDERFTHGVDSARWVDHYLPHWTTPDRSRARWQRDASGFALVIDDDQPPWLAHGEGGMRVSALQTAAAASGPFGSPDGQDRTDPDMVVVSPQREVVRYAPRFARLECRARACPHPDTMVALWTLGIDDDPARSAELCLFEIFGSEIDGDRMLVGVGVKPHDDPNVMLDFDKVEVHGVHEWHDYRVDWQPQVIEFFIDDRLVKRAAQRIEYSMQLELALFDFDSPVRAEPGDRTHPKSFAVEHVRGWRTV